MNLIKKQKNLKCSKTKTNKKGNKKKREGGERERESLKGHAHAWPNTQLACHDRTPGPHLFLFYF